MKKCCNCECNLEETDVYEHPINKGDFFCKYCYVRNNIGFIQQHSYRPEFELKKVKGEDTNLFLGIELEYEIDVRSVSSLVITDINKLFKDIGYIKRDGSLEDGFELVTYPYSVKYLISIENKFKKLFEILKSRCSGKDTCGMHIHLSKDAFNSDSHIVNFIYLWNYFDRFVMNFSGRTNRDRVDRYASFLSKSQVDFLGNIIENKSDSDLKHFLSDYEDNRYQCINTANSNTIEVRIYQAPNNYDSFMENVRITLAYLKLSEAPVLRLTKENLETFVNNFKIKHTTRDIKYLLRDYGVKLSRKRVVLDDVLISSNIAERLSSFRRYFISDPDYSSNNIDIYARMFDRMDVAELMSLETLIYERMNVSTVLYMRSYEVLNNSLFMHVDDMFIGLANFIRDRAVYGDGHNHQTMMEALPDYLSNNILGNNFVYKLYVISKRMAESVLGMRPSNFDDYLIKIISQEGSVSGHTFTLGLIELFQGCIGYITRFNDLGAFNVLRRYPNSLREVFGTLDGTRSLINSAGFSTNIETSLNSLLRINKLSVIKHILINGYDTNFNEGDLSIHDSIYPIISILREKIRVAGEDGVPF